MLPILNKLLEEPRDIPNNSCPQVLVLVPTRELALQVSEEVKKFTKYLPYIKSVCIFGGMPYPVQSRQLSKRFEILVATPGRLIDHLERKRLSLSKIKVLVLDEADRMLDMGFSEPVLNIAALCPKDRQTLLFSATIDKKVLPLSKKLQNDPEEIHIKINPEDKARIEQRVYFVDDVHHKIKLLDHILENEGIHQTIVFTSTINQAEILSDQLYDKGYKASSLHGDMNQRQRLRTINGLREGKVNILVATDVAARGIDIPSLGHVINFDLPFKPEDFVHRIGRTGRAGAQGIAITFATQKESSSIKKIGEMMGKSLEAHTISGLEPKVKVTKNAPSKSKRPFAKKKPFGFKERPFKGRSGGFQKKAAFQK
jgi:superfamily II DNA/RNA helicase